MFNYLIERELNRGRRYGRPLSLVMIDIDFFKKINDTWGHSVGDLVLRELGALMRANFRRMDVPVRYGGEEFAVILPETSLEEAINFAERFRLKVESATFLNGLERISVTITWGSLRFLILKLSKKWMRKHCCKWWIGHCIRPKSQGGTVLPLDEIFKNIKNRVRRKFF